MGLNIAANPPIYSLDGTVGATIICNGLSGVYIGLNGQRTYSFANDGVDTNKNAVQSTVFIFSGNPVSDHGPSPSSIKLPVGRAMSVGPGNIQLGFMTDDPSTSVTVTIVNGRIAYGNF